MLEKLRSMRQKEHIEFFKNEIKTSQKNYSNKTGLMIKSSKKDNKGCLNFLNELKNKRKSFDPYLTILFIIVIISTISPTYSSKKLEFRKLEETNYIILTIEGGGDHTIINENYVSFIASIQINEDEPITSGINNVQNLNSGTNTIKIIFGSSLASCNSMFQNLGDITIIDLTKLDLSLVTDMESFFDECSSLKSVDFSNVAGQYETRCTLADAPCFVYVACCCL